MPGQRPGLGQAVVDATTSACTRGAARPAGGYDDLRMGMPASVPTVHLQRTTDACSYEQGDAETDPDDQEQADRHVIPRGAASGG